MIRRPPRSTLFPTTPLFRSMATARVIASIQKAARPANAIQVIAIGHQFWWEYRYPGLKVVTANELHVPVRDRKSTRLNSSHLVISYAVFCLKKKISY